MRARGVLRVAMVGMAIGITGLVYWQWTGDTRQTNTQPAMRTEEGPELLFRTESLDYTHTVNGVPRYRVSADTNLGFEGGRQEWIDNVRLALYPVPEDEDTVPDPTVITGNKLIVRQNQAGQLRDAEIEGDVKVVLPGGAEMVTSLLTYEAEDHMVGTNQGVELHLAGLVTQARRMRYDTERGVLRLERSVTLASDPDHPSGGGEGALKGTAQALTYDVGGVGLVLEGRPQVDLTGAAIAGDMMTLMVEEESNRVHAVEARGNSRAVWGEGEAGPDNSLDADILTLDLGETMEPQLVHAQKTGLRSPRLVTSTAGTLYSDDIEFHLLPDDRGEVAANGAARWQAIAGAATGVRRVRGSRLELLLGPGGLESAVATGSVVVELVTADAGKTTSLRGESVELAWEGPDLTSGLWPEGVSYQSEEAVLEAAEGAYDPGSDTWIMRGTPRPSLNGDQFDVSADEISMAQRGGLRATGNVEAVLRGDRVAMISPVFGGAATVNVAAGVMTVTDSGNLEFGGGARLWQGDQHLQSTRMLLSGNPALLEARGDVLAILTPPAAVQADAGSEAEAAAPITLTGGLLLLEGTPPELRVAQGAELVEGERIISGSPIVVLVGADGSWRSVEVGGEVTMQDPAGTATGSSMIFDPETKELTILGTPDIPAVFANDQGVDIRDSKGLMFRWNDDDLSITALQQGQTQTVRGGT